MDSDNFYLVDLLFLGLLNIFFWLIIMPISLVQHLLCKLFGKESWLQQMDENFYYLEEEF